MKLQGGFGLLEAIVAMTILATSGLALFSWIQQSAETATRLRASDERAQLKLTALGLLGAVNPMERAQGELVVNGVGLKWRAELVEPTRPNVSFAGTPAGPWVMGLYRLDVAAQDMRNGAEVQFQHLKVGTRRTIAKAANP